MKAEVPLGEHREEHQSAGDDRLDNRELHERERTNVKQPRRDRTHPPDRPPLGGKQAAGAAKRMAAVDRWCGHRPAVAQQESRIGQQGAHPNVKGKAEEHR